MQTSCFGRFTIVHGPSFEARRERALSVYDNKLSENIYIHCPFVQTRYLKKSCAQSLVIVGYRVHEIIELFSKI
jgi:hypothetical protein